MSAHARGSGRHVQRDPRADPSDRGEGAAQAAPPDAQPAAQGLRGNDVIGSIGLTGARDGGYTARLGSDATKRMGVRAHSSVGESARLITGWSLVQVQVG